MPHRASAGCQALTLPAGSGQVAAVAFSPDGRTLATVGWGYGHTYLWDVATGRITVSLSDQVSGGGASVAFSPDGTTVAVVDGSDGVGLWDVATSRLVTVLAKPHDGPDVVAFSPDGRMLAFGTASRNVDVWDIATGRLIATLTAPHGAAVNGVAFGPDSRTLAFGDDSDQAYLCPVNEEITA